MPADHLPVKEIIQDDLVEKSVSAGGLVIDHFTFSFYNKYMTYYKTKINPFAGNSSPRRASANC